MNATKKDFISLQLASDRRKTDALKKKIQENIESIQRTAAEMTPDHCYDATFIESYAKRIQDYCNQLRDLDERIEMLNYMNGLEG